jgi:hypothetical protein
VDVTDNVPGLDFIKLLRPVTFRLDRNKVDDFTGVTEKRRQLGRESGQTENYIDSPRISGLRTGFIAQEVEAAAMSIGFDFSGVDAPKHDKDIYGLRYAEFVVPLVKAVQDLSAQNELLLERLDALEREINELKTK